MVRPAESAGAARSPAAGDHQALPERRQRHCRRGCGEILRRQTGPAPLPVVHVAEPDPHMRRPRASWDTAELLALTDLVRGDCRELRHRQAADLELLDAQLAQIGVRRADPGLAVDHGALAQPEQRVLPRWREHLAVGLPDLGQELRPQQRPDPLYPVQAGRDRRRGHERQPAGPGRGHRSTSPDTTRGSSTRSTASRSRSGEGCKYTWLEVIAA